MKITMRSLLLAITTCVVPPLVSASQNGLILERGALQMRASDPPESTTAVSSESSAAPPTSTQVTTSAAATSSSTVAAATSSAASTTAAAAQSSTSSSRSADTTPASGGSTPAVTSHVVETSAVATTNAAGQVFTSIVEYTPTPSSPPPSQTSSSSSNGSGSNDDNSGLGTGSIIGLSVAGGIAALGIISFFVWKFTRKRFSDFDDNEAIKWPELNAHNTDVHALPTHSTGQAGFGPENDSDANLTRAPSPGAYANSIAASSVPDVYSAGDPYAVPPLPHLNPNQPYRDDPGAFGQPGGFYDPYRGPAPGAFTDTMSDGHGAESIPMTQMARMRNTGPQSAYDTQGRASPAPQAVTGYANVDERSRTPNPTTLGAGRASPGPYSGYGHSSQ